MPSPPVTVLVAVRSPLLREALVRLLEGFPELAVDGRSAATGTEALDRAVRGPCAVVLADVDLPGMDGGRLARLLAEQRSSVEVVLLAEHDDDATLRRALGAGARGLLSRNCTVDQLVAALRAAARGDYASSRPDLEDRLAEFVAPPPREARAGGRITPREREIARLLADGYSSKEIAGILRISVKTVDTHRASLMRKLGAHNVAEVVKYCIRNRLIEI